MATMFCFQSSDRQLHEFLLNMLCFSVILFEESIPRKKTNKQKKKIRGKKKNMICWEKCSGEYDLGQ